MEKYIRYTKNESNKEELMKIYMSEKEFKEWQYQKYGDPESPRQNKIARKLRERTFDKCDQQNRLYPGGPLRTWHEEGVPLIAMWSSSRGGSRVFD